MSWINETIKAKSDQLNAVDLLAGPIVVTVESVNRGNTDQPCIIAIGNGFQPYKPCKTMRRVLVKVWGEHVEKWVGRKMRLFCDETVKWGGEAVGGLRISHVSNIDAPISVQVNATKGKKATITVQPLVETPATKSIEERIEALTASMQKATTFDELRKKKDLGMKLYNECNDEQKKTINAAFDLVKERLGNERPS